MTPYGSLFIWMMYYQKKIDSNILLLYKDQSIYGQFIFFLIIFLIPLKIVIS